MTAKKKVVAKKAVEDDGAVAFKNVLVFIIGAVIGGVLVNLYL